MSEHKGTIHSSLDNLYCIGDIMTHRELCRMSEKELFLMSKNKKIIRSAIYYRD